MNYRGGIHLLAYSIYDQINIFVKLTKYIAVGSYQFAQLSLRVWIKHKILFFMSYFVRSNADREWMLAENNNEVSYPFELADL